MSVNILPLLLIPLLGTMLGSAAVLLLSDKSANLLQKPLLGFASGVMVAASVWSLLIPAIEESQAMESLAWIPAIVGFLIGMGFMLLLDIAIPHLHLDSSNPEGPRTKLERSTMIILAIALHNIPEGMAVGVVAAGVLAGNAGMSMAGAVALAIGIALQNIPEGAIISMPLRSAGNSRGKAFLMGALSGLVEPIAAVTTILFSEYLMGIFPYLLAFAAGAMLYVVVEELIPESHSGNHSNSSTIGFAIGFALMIVLDVALG